MNVEREMMNESSKSIPQAHECAAAQPQSCGEAKPSRAWMLFPGIVISLLAGHVALCVTAITLAVGGQGYAVVPDYYEKAVHWDETQALRRASEALGWSAVIQLDAASGADALGQRTVTITMLDRDGHPITDAVIKASYFHLANASKHHNITLPHTSSGVYVTAASMPNNGLWQVDLRATRGQDVFVSTQRIDTSETLTRQATILSPRP